MAPAQSTSNRLIGSCYGGTFSQTQLQMCLVDIIWPNDFKYLVWAFLIWKAHCIVIWPYTVWILCLGSEMFRSSGLQFPTWDWCQLCMKAKKLESPNVATTLPDAVSCFKKKMYLKGICRVKAINDVSGALAWCSQAKRNKYQISDRKEIPEDERADRF